MSEITSDAVLDAYKHGWLLIGRSIYHFLRHYLYAFAWLFLLYGILIVWALFVAPAGAVPWDLARVLSVGILLVAAPLSWGALYRWYLKDRGRNDEDPDSAD